MIACANPSCGHNVVVAHSSDADPDDIFAPCMVDGCGCPDGVVDDAGLQDLLKGGV